MNAKHERIEGPDGSKLIVRTRLVDQLPNPKDAARDAMRDGVDDRRVNDPWVRDK